MKKLLFLIIIVASYGSQAQIKISALPSITGTNADNLLVPVVQGGVTKKAPGSIFKGSGRDSSAYTSMIKINDSSYAFRRLNGTKDTFKIIVAGGNVIKDSITVDQRYAHVDSVSTNRNYLSFDKLFDSLGLRVTDAFQVDSNFYIVRGGLPYLFGTIHSSGGSGGGSTDSTLQQAFDKSVAAGDYPTIDGHGQDNNFIVANFGLVYESALSYDGKDYHSYLGVNNARLNKNVSEIAVGGGSNNSLDVFDGGAAYLSNNYIAYFPYEENQPIDTLATLQNVRSASGGGVTTFEQSLQNQGSTPFSTDNDVDLDGHSFIMEGLSDFNISTSVYKAGIDIADSIISFVGTSNVGSTRSSTVSVQPDKIKISSTDISLFPIDREVKIQARIDSSDANSNNVAWFDSENILHRGALTAKPYKVYTALLSQQDGNPPIATILENTIGEITYTELSPGGLVWKVNSIGNLFTAGKTVAFTNQQYGSANIVRVDFVNDVPNYIYLNQSSIATGLTVGDFDSIMLEIRVYN